MMRLNDRCEAVLDEPGEARPGPPGLRLGYFPVAQLLDGRAVSAGASVLGAVIFGRNETGSATVTATAQGFGLPVLAIDIPLLGPGTDSPSGHAEVWSIDDPVTGRGEIQGARYSCSAEVMFGCTEIDEAELVVGQTVSTPSLHAATLAAYDGIFSAIDALGFPQLLRVWNYVPDITDEIGGIERYHSFNAGRQEAFLAHRRSISSGAPAASALGIGGSELKVYFLAARHAPLAIENPRQVSAYHYPPRYGPRSPTFSRAALAQVGTRRMLFISGTASIVGHESRHSDDIGGQIDETLENVDLLLKQASRSGSERSSFEPPFLKVYLRNAVDFDAVRSAVERRFGADVPALYLQAELCRSELLVEIEATATESVRHE